MNPIEIIEKYYDKKSELYEILIKHSSQVRDKALEVVQKHSELGADSQFVAEAAMLHDIGIIFTNAPKIYCFGKHNYIEHGYLGSELLQQEGFLKHALVCERHTGVGLSLDWIVRNKLPVPHRDMVPISIEEQIICYADKFFSKTNLNVCLPIEVIVKKLEKHEKSNSSLFLEWHNRFR
ncbi:MAG: HDIG domain-containing protein [Porphyromonadaceae bacterium]|nr:HDIG domain-containing protein [Porphyromonadaceae bacterium]